jgi:hypothetical protein
VRRLLATAVVAVGPTLLVGASCKSGGGPITITFDQVNEALVDAGCIEPGYGSFVAAEVDSGKNHQLVGAIECMLEGGAIVGCNVPCERAGYVRRPSTEAGAQ